MLEDFHVMPNEILCSFMRFTNIHLLIYNPNRNAAIDEKTRLSYKAIVDCFSRSHSEKYFFKRQYAINNYPNVRKNSCLSIIFLIYEQNICHLFVNKDIVNLINN